MLTDDNTIHNTHKIRHIYSQCDLFIGGIVHEGNIGFAHKYSADADKIQIVNQKVVGSTGNLFNNHNLHRLKNKLYGDDTMKNRTAYNNENTKWIDIARKDYADCHAHRLSIG